MRVRAVFSEDKKVTLEALIEGEVYRDEKNDLFMFILDIKDGMYLWNLSNFRLTPFEVIPKDTELIHVQTLNSLIFSRQ